MKVLTTNIWRYYNWKKRKEKLVNFLKNENADIIFLQEATYDGRLKESYKNQVDEINRELNYSSLVFGRLMEMKKWHNTPIDWEMFYGLGFLSKYPIKHSEVIILSPVKTNKKFGFMHAIIETGEGDIDLINVHFENTDEGSKKHLKQTLEWCKEKNLNPIIAGDFNMKLIDDLKELAINDYEISYLIKQYKSFMPTQFSHNEKPITLDYLIAHKNKFKIMDVKCINNDVSDHNPLIVELKV
ncbi:hypothetical protein HN992_03445 [Candidatus Woesearchaeota archaeon]|jgi:endonuclease/exonuclease/phosphatase family metal-dependent hydrolase|nr:hypothetical protein [archaeon]MBT3438973.1 hypothetical protein [Candidatus Woesearchaeota archaeon]MBT4058229.1 hypothetical protein [Candidatus Woesearchaeota archaeon]MBT4208304.1 hypothetical protein [Candidatus Woesearchaeota archaeon]MBT4730855.1 hypothetical protein [Candidatus Woesearchaeota archaeon]